MIPRLSFFALGVAMLAAVASAGEGDAKNPAPKDDAAKAKQEQKADKAADDGKNPEERVQEILGKLDERFNDAVEGLDKKDTTDTTRKAQGEIVDLIDELLKQKQKNNQGGGGGGGGASSSGGSSSSGESSADSSSSNGGGSSRQNQQPQGNGGANQPQGGNEQKQGEGGQEQKEQKQGGGSEQKQQAKGGQGLNEDKSPQPKGGDGQAKGGGNDQKKGNGGQGGPMAPKDNRNEKNTIADLHKEVWGHLPQSRRQEMDSFSRERFHRNYEELLRQYYRTIAEGRNKDAD